jgi:hypothetical protein
MVLGSLKNGRYVLRTVNDATNDADASLGPGEDGNIKLKHACECCQCGSIKEWVIYFVHFRMVHNV